jgi:two-component system, sensor histidine kinase LadS
MYDKIKGNEEILKKALAKLQDSQTNIKQQNDLLIEKDKRIGSSIKVAQFIQQSILPSEQDFEAYFKDCFVFYKPKDSVSGDFYFLQKINDKILLIVADCTGHGVPGAFITIVGKYILDRVIHERKSGFPATKKDQRQSWDGCSSSLPSTRWG